MSLKHKDVISEEEQEQKDFMKALETGEFEGRGELRGEPPLAAPVGEDHADEQQGDGGVLAAQRIEDDRKQEELQPAPTGAAPSRASQREGEEHGRRGARRRAFSSLPLEKGAGGRGFTSEDSTHPSW